MKMTLQPMLALFSFDSGERAVVTMFALVLVMIAGMALLALFLFGIFRLLGRLSGQSEMRPAPTTRPEPPAAISTQIVSRQCPKCGTLLKSDAPEGLCPACLLQNAFATEGGVPPGTPPFTPPPLGELAKLFPQLEIIEAIGQGGMGAVYKARQPALDRFVALKILAPRSRSDVDFSGRFSREARALAKLSHPNIVAVYDFGQISNQPAISA